VSYYVAWNATPDSNDTEIGVASYSSVTPGIGQHTFNVRAIDVAGNVGPVEAFIVNVGARQYVVNSLADGGSITDGQFTLREALESANADVASGDAGVNSSFIAVDVDRVVFSPALIGGTIVLNGTELTITDDIDIYGLGNDQLAVNANGLSHVFHVDFEASVLIDGLTITGGYSDSNGGGIYNAGTLMLANSVVSGNNSASYGGGIDNGGTLAVANGTLSGNSARHGGGGIVNFGGIVTLTNTTLSGNSARNGGGIYNSWGDLTLSNSVAAGNVGDSGEDIDGDYSAESSFVGTVDGDPMWTAFADANGMTMYYLPRAGSPLIDSGGNALAVDPGGLPLTTDQRGRTRIVNGVVDIGAVELPLEPELSVSPTPTLETPEGQSSVISVSLTSAPVAPVTVSIVKLPGGSGDIVADMSVLEFDAGNWHLPQAVTITAADDADRDNDAAVLALSATGMDTVHVFASVVDDDYQTYLVDSLLDVVAPDGCLTLREAVEAANTNTSVNEALEGCEGAADIINFAPSLSGGSIVLDGTQLTVSDDLEIYGLGADQLAIDASDESRVFYVAAGAAVLISDLAITGGDSDYGGGIYNYGALTLVGIRVSDNSVDWSGGGINNEGSLRLTNATVSDNSACYGGGINNDGILTLGNTVISGNHASSAGGGVFNENAFSLTNSTVSDNYVDDGPGGGICSDFGGDLTLINSTVIGNLVYGDYGSGGGIYSGDWDTVLTLKNSVVAGNTAPAFADLYGTLHEDSSHNFLGSENGDPVLTAVAYSGGMIPCYAPQTGSPLINAGSNALAMDEDGLPLATDQIGNPRVFYTFVDIGAIEYVLPGDADGNGMVHDEDYEILIGEFGRSGDSLVADFNYDDRVDLVDFTILRGNFGNVFPMAPSAALPTDDEPTALASAPMIPVVSPPIDDRDARNANDVNVDLIATAAFVPTIDFLMPSPSSADYISEPQPISVGLSETTLRCAATAEYDLRPLSDDPPARETYDLSADILSESLLTVELTGLAV